jgi:excisionase family DNA binding protein
MRIQIGKSKPLPIPLRLQQQVLNILTVASHGSNVAVTPLTSTLTTQEAADILGVSRPHIVSLVESKKIPSTKVGSHRRILRADLDMYLKRQNSRRSTALSYLMRETQKLGLSYTTRKGS